MYFSYKKKLPHSKRRDSVCHSAIKMWLLGYVVGAVGLVVGLVVVLLVISKLKRSLKVRSYPNKVKKGNFSKLLSEGKKDDEICDVLVIGAGPSGSTFSYYLSKSDPQLKINLVDRCRFPRKKYCGDAWCAPALDILEDMGILQELEKGETDLPIEQEYIKGRPLCRAVQRGGFVSPAGHECIGGPYGSSVNIRTYAIKRYVVDEFIARKAASVGANLMEECEIEEMKFDKENGLWIASTKGGMEIKARVAVIADGSNSFLARKLGLVSTPPDSVCSHQYVMIDEKDRSNFDADGVMFFTKSLLPGYSAIFKHYDNDIYLGTYILPGGQSTATWIKPFEDRLLTSYQYIRHAMGLSQEKQKEDLNFRESKKVAPIRTGGEKQSYDDHLLIIGDAAGQVDPLTGEGIHTAMIGGKIAANVVSEMFKNGDFSSGSTSVYHRLWMEEFGEDFWWSSAMATALVWCPLAVDAMAVVGQRKGQAFLDEFGEMMTGVRSKVGFLSPHLALPLALELIVQVNQFTKQYILKCPPCVPDCGVDIARKEQEKTDKKAH